MELEQFQGILVQPPADYRPRLEAPPPVRLLTVADTVLPAAAGLERALDGFYVELLKFVRDAVVERIVYRAENFRLSFEIVECPSPPPDFRPVKIEVPLLRDFELALIEREIDYTRHKGLLPGQVSITLLDPAGNWVEVSESRPL
jgi:hypothetical protein